MSRHEIKLKRLIQTYRQTVSEAIVTALDDERLKNLFITVTDVEIDNEMTKAAVYFTLLDSQKKNKAIKALYSARQFILSSLRKKIKIKFLPPIVFIFDERESKANELCDRIDLLAAEYKKKRTGCNETSDSRNSETENSETKNSESDTEKQTAAHGQTGE